MRLYMIPTTVITTYLHIPPLYIIQLILLRSKQSRKGNFDRPQYDHGDHEKHYEYDSLEGHYDDIP